MVVGGGGGGNMQGGSGSKMARENDGDDYNYNNNNSNIDYGDGSERPIRPKERSTYDDRDPDIGELETDEQMLSSRYKEEKFAPGSHPLEGVPNLSELPTPEDLIGKSRDLSEQSGITNLIGEYRARCLFSKVWILREASVLKIHMLLNKFCEDAPGINTCLPVLCTIVRVGVEDKIQQVLFNSIDLMESLLTATRNAKLVRSHVAPLIDPIVANIIEKLADGNTRIRDGAKKGCEILAASGGC